MSLSPGEPLKPRLSRLGLGAATFGREIDQETSFAMMDHARKIGFALIDTAASYGDGTSEKIVGAWLASRRPGPKEFVVATKMLPPYDVPRVGEFVDKGLVNLGVDSLDVFYLHDWHESAADPAVLIALDAAVRAGKVRTLAVSNFNPEQLTRVARIQQERGLTRFQAVQNNHNFAVRNAGVDVRRVAAAENIAVVTYSPLGAGFLTGKHKHGIAPGSRFDIKPSNMRHYASAEADARLAQLEAAAARTGRALPHLALMWVIHQPGIDMVLIGGRGPKYLDQAVAALKDTDPEALKGL